MKNTRKITIISLIAILSLFLMASSSYALTVNVNFNPGATQYINQLTGYAVFGDMMDGMDVTAYFTNNTSETVSWADTGPGAGGVTGTNWSLAESGDTFGGIWTLINNSSLTIDHILIDAMAGDTVFDIDYPSSTPGSAAGWTFQVTNSSDPNLNITATYINQVAIVGNAPVGDIYQYLDIDFNSAAGAAGGFGPKNTLNFIADTDNVDVPEPGTMLLLGMGLLSVAGFRKKD